MVAASSTSRNGARAAQAGIIDQVEAIGTVRAYDSILGSIPVTGKAFSNVRGTKSARCSI